MLSSILNPKVALFFLAFLPQFIEPTQGSVAWQIMTLGSILIALTILCYILVALVAGTVSNWLQNRSRLVKFQKWLTGSFLISLGVHLALSEQH